MATIYGKLTLIERIHIDEKGIEYWLCDCSCGESEVVGLDRLENDSVSECRQCILEQRKIDLEIHGYHMSKHPLYATWRGMLDRCNNAANASYDSYGGRGIEVCAEWYSMYEFVEDMGPKTNPMHSIERRNVNGHYDPYNCYWGTDFEQANNRRNTQYITFDGLTYPRGVWRQILISKGVAPDVVDYRLKQKWTLRELLSGVINPKHRSGAVKHSQIINMFQRSSTND